MELPDRRIFYVAEIRENDNDDAEAYSAVLPDIWLSTDQTLCKYPPAKENPNAKAMRREPYKDSWGTFKVTKLFTPSFDSFNKARLKLSKSSDASDFHSEEEKGRGKRKKIQNSKYTSEVVEESEDSSSDADEDKWLEENPYDNGSETQFPGPFTQNRPLSGLTNTSNPVSTSSAAKFNKSCVNTVDKVFSGDVSGISHATMDSPFFQPTQSSRPKGFASSTQKGRNRRDEGDSDNVPPENVNVSRTSPMISKKMTSQPSCHEVFDSPVSKKANHEDQGNESFDLNSMLLQVLSNQKKIMNNIDNVKKKLEHLTLTVQDQSRTIDNVNILGSSFYNDNEFMSLWPVTSNEDLLLVDKKLMESADLVVKLKAYLSRQDGRNAVIQCSNMFRSILSDEIGRIYSWCGKSGKEFRKLKIGQVVKEVAMEKNASVGEQAVSTALSDWFRFANSRINRKEKSKQKQTVNETTPQ